MLGVEFAGDELLVFEKDFDFLLLVDDDLMKDLSVHCTA